ncbi:hypothetical protein PsorP6_019432 [Peronosclerospora sorghi]|nr:hypothetical protein PsorP6_019432 [Peronosclerospora sorghi]
MTEMVWQNDEEKKGIIPSHTGRCLIKIDNQSTRSFRQSFRSIIRFAPPGQECMLKFYWWALHEVNWQLYKHCVPIKNGGGSGKQSPPSDDDADQSGKQDTPSSPSPSQSPTPNNPSTPPSSGSPSPSSPPSSGSPSPSSPPYSGSGGSAPSGSPSSSPPSSDATGNKCVRRI